MTNETITCAAAAAPATVKEAFAQALGQGQGVCEKIITWATEQGLAFAVNVVLSAVILLVGWLAIKLLAFLITKAVSRRGAQRAILLNFVRSAVTKVCWTVLIVVVLGRLGLNVAPIIAGLGVTGFILGFAFQESLGNLASGLMIAINEPFKIGDYVIVAGLEGTVLKVDIMATTLATADNKKVVIPNKCAWGTPITNFSALGRRRVDIRIGIDYDSDVPKAIRIALQALESLPGVLKDPAPSVSVASLDDSQVTLNVRPWAEGADYWTVYNGACQAIKAAFDANGVAIPFPQLTVHLDK